MYDGNESPFLEQIELAREHARLENFDASLSAYSAARSEVEIEIQSCKNSAVLMKWNSLLKDIKAEEATVMRLKDVVESILDKVTLLPSDDEDQPIEDPSNPQWSRNDDIMDLPPSRKIRGRDRRPNIDGVRQVGKKPAGRQPPGFSVTPIRAQPRQKESAREPQRRAAASRQNVAKAAPSRPPQKAQQQEKPAASDKQSLDPATNPLVRQIIDMGILIREPNVSWDSIAGLAQVKRLLRQNLVILPMRPDICKGLLAPWKSVLFYGPPGTGKTFLAKAVATECQRTFFNITSATITSKWHGESEKLVSYMFDLADQMAPATIFFDEIDSIASQRGGSNENEASRRMKAQLLTKLEGIDGASDNTNVFVLAATNFPWDLDEALLRRFQKRIYIPLPDVEGRLAILKMSLSDMIEDDSFAIREWAEKLEGYSCADIANLCRDAAQMVFNEKMDNMDPDDFVNMSAEDIRVIIRDCDFAKAVKNRKSSVDQNSLKRYDEWRLSKGAE